ncbi:hypothetical protein CLOLEP_02537 [[Clostridium] leptum DSM 753]|uniref:Uncharacterized protein n=1 Tax=[Clostridium] leptum DSM 753 TaxID=428125 RepID=A7VVC5_9FIRM|nr:hypothetical protein CLOLEP_02537 [[Clostridium] leptum DSM 753]
MALLKGSLFIAAVRVRAGAFAVRLWDVRRPGLQASSYSARPEPLAA